MNKNMQRVMIFATLNKSIKLFKKLGYVIDKNRLDEYPDRVIHHMYKYLSDSGRFHIRLYYKNKFTYFEIHRDDNFTETGHDIKVNDWKTRRELNRIERFFLDNGIGFI